MDRQILKYLGYFQLQLKNMLVKKVSQMIKGSRYICLRFEGLKKDLKKKYTNRQPPTHANKRNCYVTLT